MRRYLPRQKTLLAVPMVLFLAVYLAGCGSVFLTARSQSEAFEDDVSPLMSVDRYVENRLYDLADVFQIGLGVASYDAEVGIFPPLLGAHVQATDFAKLGSLSFTGNSVEWDGRGLFMGPEHRTRRAIGRWEMLHIEQRYDRGFENYFKKSDSYWADRMRGDEMTWRNTPAKELNYTFWADEFHLGIPPFHRGWQHWSSTGVEACVFPFTIRTGVDFTEVFDFALGFALIDTKNDDMDRREYNEKRKRGPHIEGDSDPKPVAEIEPYLLSEK